MSDEDIEEMFNFADADGDGKLSYAEFQVNNTYLIILFCILERKIKSGTLLVVTSFSVLTFLIYVHLNLSIVEFTLR